MLEVDSSTLVRETKPPRCSTRPAPVSLSSSGVTACCVAGQHGVNGCFAGSSLGARKAVSPAGIGFYVRADCARVHCSCAALSLLCRKASCLPRLSCSRLARLRMSARRIGALADTQLMHALLPSVRRLIHRDNLTKVRWTRRNILQEAHSSVGFFCRTASLIDFDQGAIRRTSSH